MDEYLNFMADVRKATGLDVLVPDDAGFVTIRVDDHYNLSLQYIEDSFKVMCFVEVMTLAKDAPKAVYRDLLAGGLFGKDTAGGYFALEAETETVVYNYMFDLAATAYDVNLFVTTIENILTLCEMWEERIKSTGEPARGIQMEGLMV